MEFNFQDGNQQTMPLNGLFPDNSLQMYNIDQASVLDSNDQGYLNSFFANPDNTVPLDVLPSGQYSMNAKEGQANESDNPNYRLNQQPQTGLPAVTYATVPSSMYSTFAGGNNGSPALPPNVHGHGHSQMWNAPPQNHVSTDNAAANSLVNLAKTTPQQQPTPAFTNESQQVLSWGNFTAPHYNPQMNMNFPHQQYGFPSPSTPHAPNYTLSQFPRHHSISYATEHPDYAGAARAQQQQVPHVQPLSQSSATRTRHMSIGATPDVPGGQALLRQQPAQSAASALRYPDRPQVPVRFGSDNNFGTQGYRNPSERPAKHDKSGNLLNAFGVQMPLPGIAPVARAPSTTHGDAGAGSAARDTHSARSSPTHLGGLPLPTPSSSKQHKSAWDSGRADDGDSGRNGQQSARKRRRTGDNDDREYVPVSATSRRGTRPFKEEASDDDEDDFRTSSNKRRKSATFHGSDQSGSPGGGDDEDDEEGEGGSRKKSRGSKRPRENLSESQKRFNHIMSEKKRRDIINQGYSDLNRLVPLLSQGKSGMSRSESLGEVASYLESLVEGTKEVMRHLGIAIGDDLIGSLARPTASSAAGGRYFDDGEYD